jgi:hypothetical protein
VVGLLAEGVRGRVFGIIGTGNRPKLRSFLNSRDNDARRLIHWDGNFPLMSNGVATSPDLGTYFGQHET